MRIQPKIPLLITITLVSAASLFAQSDSTRSDGQQVVIHRQAIRIKSPDTYRVSLHLEPVKSFQMTAPVDGVVQAIHVKPGDQLPAQGEAGRLDTREFDLIVRQKKALVRAAEVELRRANKVNDQELIQLSEAKLDAARAEFDLATLRRERASILAPFPAEVFRIHVTPGERVRAGQPLLRLADPSKLRVEIPIDRNRFAPGDPIDIKVENETVRGRIESILPLSENFEPLRELVDSAASAIVTVDNAGGKLQVGQTVYAPMIPLDPVAQVPSKSLIVSPGPDELRKVQVVRDGVVRDISVTPLGQAGPQRVFVTGSFDERDELIVETSQSLPDGTRIRPVTADVPTPKTSGGQPSRTGVGF